MNEITKEASKQSEKQSSQEAPKQGNLKLGLGFASRGTVHTFQNFGDATAQMLVMVTPGGFNQFFEELSSLNRGLAAPDLVRTEQLMNAYGIELLGPPLS